MELERTSFSQSRRFRWLRYFMAAGVVCFYFGKFFYGVVIEAYYLSQSGPVAMSSTYAFSLDDLIVALIPAAVLISEFEVVAKLRTYYILRAVCIIVGMIAILGGFFFLQDAIHLLDYNSFDIGLAAFILRQASIVLAAIYFYHRISVRSSEADTNYD
jgi:hypothetical protein